MITPGCFIMTGITDVCIKALTGQPAAQKISHICIQKSERKEMLGMKTGNVRCVS